MKKWTQRSGAIKIKGKIEVFDKKSLFLFHIDSWFRKKLIKVLESFSFEIAILVLVLANTILLACKDFKDREDLTKRNQVLKTVDNIFSVIFIFEALIKVIGLGFVFHYRSYLRNGWNTLDFAILISTIFVMSQGGVNLKPVRLLRVLKMLVTIKQMPKLKRQINALISAVPNIAAVLSFLFFLLLLFGILGLHQYNGSLYNACRTSEVPLNSTFWPKNESSKRVCSTTGLGAYKCAPQEICGNPVSQQISILNDGALNNSHIQYGTFNFDTIEDSMLVVFIIAIRDGWSQNLYNLMDADLPLIGIMYYGSIIILGSFFVMYLILAVLISSLLSIKKNYIFNKLDSMASVLLKNTSLIKEKENYLSQREEQVRQLELGN
mmetsp:Transcript_10534/g.10604  ORF Transcript_10534/g.10604 Transcript_10534/m.10604 type:complete len:379 (-) Transcript_10534:700-1836(-)